MREVAAWCGAAGGSKINTHFLSPFCSICLEWCYLCRVSSKLTPLSFIFYFNDGVVPCEISRLCALMKLLALTVRDETSLKYWLFNLHVLEVRILFMENAVRPLEVQSRWKVSLFQVSRSIIRNKLIDTVQFASEELNIAKNAVYFLQVLWQLWGSDIFALRRTWTYVVIW